MAAPVVVPAIRDVNVVQALEPTWQALPAVMEENGLHGASVAVFDGYEIVATHAVGIKSVATGEPLDEETVFSTASISKPVTALVALILHERGDIDLDRPVSAYLSRWQLPQSDVAGASDVMLRHLLRHTGGTTQHGFADFYEGDTIPTLIDSVEGRLPRYDGPIAFTFPPGSSWSYSGGGYVIAQMALEDHLEEPLAELAQRFVFRPFGMDHTSMIQPGSPGFSGNAALVHDENGAIIGTGLPITPQISASGMWSNPSDLARFAIGIQKALAGRTDAPISEAAARAMTDVFSLEHVGGMGTPFFRGFGLGNTDWFRHDGSNTGVNADMMGSMEGGYGLVMMGNGDDPNTDGPFAFLRSEIIGRMEWSARRSFDAAPADPALFQSIAGNYTGLLYGLGLPYEIGQDADGPWISSPFFTQFLGREQSRMIYLGDNQFAIADYPNLIRFEQDDSGALTGVVITRPGIVAEPYVRDITQLRE